jgi:uncharacterized protein (TIRG00374 family)
LALRSVSGLSVKQAPLSIKFSLNSRFLWGSLGFLVTAIALYFALRKLNLESFMAEMGSFDWRLFGAALILAISHNLILAARWHAILQPSAKVSFATAFWSLRLTYFLNCIFPAKLGEPFRIVFLKARTKITVGHALGAIVADRFLDAAVLVCLLYISALVLGLRQSYSSPLTIVSVLVAGVGILIFMKLPHHSSVKWLHSILQFTAKVRSGMKPLLKPKILGATLGYTLYGWLAHGLIVLLLVYGVDERLSIFKAFVVVGAVTLASAIPASPANIGTFEFAVITCLRTFFQFNLAQAATIAILYHFVQLLPTLAFGLVGSYLYGLKRP